MCARGVPAQPGQHDALNAGNRDTCLLGPAGEGSVCWDNNQAGQLGDGHLQHRACSIHGDCKPTPVAVVGLP